MMEIAKTPPLPFDNNLSQIPVISNDLKDNNENNPKADSNKKTSRLNPNIGEKIMEMHFKLWEILVNMKIHYKN